jgi:hypothetical protein
MSVEAMAKPLNKIKKIRSLDEFLTRGGQAIAAYREQKSGAHIPNDEEFSRLVDRAQFGSAPIIAETLWQKFYVNGRERFFPAFNDAEGSADAFREAFGGQAAAVFVNSAENIIDGRIDLLGLKGLYVGKDIDWHLEPLTSKRSPLKHWKQFDDLDPSETGNKKIVWELNRHQHFFTLGVAYWMTDDERMAETFVRHLDSWMDDNPPGIGINWSSSLEVAIRAMSWIWAFHFFRESDHFTPAVFNKALKFLYLHGRHIEKYLSKYYSPNTHLTGEALGLYYLGSQLPFLECASRWRELGEDILLAEITRQVLPDGVYFEQSTWYQRYTAEIYTHFAVLRSLYGEPYYSAAAIELKCRLQKAFDYLMHLTQPDGSTPLIGDDDGGRMLPLTTTEPDDLRGTLSLGAIIFERADHKHVSGAPGQEIFWLTGTEGMASYASMVSEEPSESSRGFGQGGYCVMRDGWSDTDNFLVVDCGEVGALSGGHGHADALSIEVVLHGKALFVDSGTYTYHESAELRDYFRSTPAHNTLTVDGLSSSEPGSTFSWRSRAESELTRWISRERFDFFEGSHTGYERLGDGAKHTRSILFAKGDYWIMRDLVAGTGHHEYALNFHYSADARPTVCEDDRWVGDEKHRLFTFGDNGTWQQKESWISNHHGNRVNAPFLRFISHGEGQQEFFTFIMPVDGGIEPPIVGEVPVEMGRAFIIKYRGYTDVFVYNDEPGQPIDNGIFISNFDYTWARLRPGETLPDEFILINGDRLSIGGKEIFESHTASASALRLGRELYVKTDLSRAVRII